MGLTIPDEIIHSTRMSIPELKQEIAVMLFEKQKLSMEQASKLAEMSIPQFQHLLASRQVPIHYGVEDFEQDLETLREMKRL